jgi:L-2,4-diaminobutyrate transaminase
LLFSHGFTYSGHPLAAAAANAALDVVETDGLVENSRRVGAYLLQGLTKAVGQHEAVGEVRGAGLLAAVEFVADREKKRRFAPEHKVGARVSAAARKRGLIARAMPHGDILGFAPPLIMTTADADQMIAITKAAVDDVADELARERVI